MLSLIFYSLEVNIRLLFDIIVISVFADIYKTNLGHMGLLGFQVPFDLQKHYC